MNEIEEKMLRTPIEIALGIDENGMTTARALYEFLSGEKSHFARWAKTNIEENEFYEENKDWLGFATVANGNNCKDYRLTTDFAKHLSMESHSARGKEARQYFVAVENKAKEAAINRSQLSPQLQALYGLIETQARQELEQKRQAAKLDHVEQRVESIREVVAMDTTSWRDDTGNILRKIGMELGGGQAYSQVRTESYELLSKRMGVNLKQRLTNKRRRMADEGICKSTRDKLSYVDIIAEDKKLIEGYTAIVKELAIRYGVA